MKDAISTVFLNPLIWLYTDYNVQREMYMFLIQQFDNDPRLLRSLCRLPRVIDMIRQFYWDSVKSRLAIGSKPLLHPITKQVIGERPSREEIRKIRLLLLSLGEMSLRYCFLKHVILVRLLKYKCICLASKTYSLSFASGFSLFNSDVCVCAGRTLQ